MLIGVRTGGRQHPFQSHLELTPIDESGERIVGRLILELLGQLLGLGDVGCHNDGKTFSAGCFS